MCMGVLHAYKSVHRVCVCVVPQKSQEYVGSFGTDKAET